jgi:hypothetical protein
VLLVDLGQASALDGCPAIGRRTGRIGTIVEVGSLLFTRGSSPYRPGRAQDAKRSGVA